VGCNTHVHGSNARNLSVYPFLFQANKNAMSFLLSLMFSLQQNWRMRAEQVLPGSEGVEGQGGEMAQQCIHI
jgi:hypothetical protein